MVDCGLHGLILPLHCIAVLLCLKACDFACLQVGLEGYPCPDGFQLVSRGVVANDKEYAVYISFPVSISLASGSTTTLHVRKLMSQGDDRSFQLIPGFPRYRDATANRASLVKTCGKNS